MSVIEPGEAGRDPGFHWLDALNNGKRPTEAAGGARWPDAVEHMADVVYAERSGRPLLLDLVRPMEAAGGRLPVILYIHGGGWSSGSRKSVPDAFWLFPGFIRISIDYRLTGAAPYPAQLQDCQAAVRWVRAHAEELGADPGRIGVWGSSAGGHLASLLGLAGEEEALDGEPHASFSHRVQAVVSCSGPSNLPELEEWQASVSKLITGRLNRFIRSLPSRRPLLGRPAAYLLGKAVNRFAAEISADSLESLLGCKVKEKPALWRQASPMGRLPPALPSGGLPPFLLMHGTTDPLVPVYQSVSFCAALQSAGARVEWVPLPGHGHSTYWDHTGTFRKENMMRIFHFLEKIL